MDVDFTVVSGPVSLSGNLLTIEGAGTAVIAANQEGNHNYQQAQEVTRTFNIAKAEQKIDIEPINDKLTNDDPFEVIASVSSDLELIYEASGPASISGSLVILDGSVGSVTVTVSQNGNENYNAAQEEISFEVTEPNITSLDSYRMDIKVFPNPTSDYVTISFDQHWMGESWILYDATGTIVNSGLIFELGHTINLTTLKSGIYFFHTSGQGNNDAIRIIKQ